jgi:hypothetical protein
MTKEALKLALEALGWTDEWRPQGLKEEAITAIKAALEAKDEPVAWNAGIPPLYPKMKEGETISVEYVELTPPQQDGKCKHCTDGCPACDSRKLPEQEPFEYWNAVEGWVKIDEMREHFDSVGCGTIYKTAGEGREPLYTTPPQRTWVGLTEDEQTRLFTDWDEDEGWGPFIEAIEAKLKEKNT